MLNHFYWVIEKEVAGMGLPTASRAFLFLEDADRAAREELDYEIDQLKERGIGAVVSLTENPIAGKEFEEAGIRYLHLPVPDMTAPTQSQINQFIQFVNENLRNERPVAVHCLSGAGRTGTMAACYLVSKGYTPSDAIKTVRKLRPGSIETRWQEEAILEFADRAGELDVEL